MDRKYPCAIVWTALPGLTFWTRVIGHAGITDSQGCIYDAAGGNTVGVGRLFCGPVLKRVDLDIDDKTKWDAAVAAANHFFRTHTYSFFTQNCHHHTAMALNLYEYEGRTNWGPIAVANLIRTKGIPVAKSIVKHPATNRQI